MVRVINNITKEYPQMIKVIIYKDSKRFVVNERIKRRKEQVGDDYTPSITSLTRTKTLVRDLVLCNDFDLFCTFTFNPKLLDTFNFNKCRTKMLTWLHHQRNNSRELHKEFKYLIIPEQHKSGRWHFHALISGYTGTLHDSHMQTQGLRPIYNITSFRSGFTTAVRIDERESVASYVTKYITKDFIKEFNQRRFFCSSNLVRPKKVVNSSLFRETLPLFRRKVGENRYTEEYILPVFNAYPTHISQANRTPYHLLPPL